MEKKFKGLDIKFHPDASGGKLVIKFNHKLVYKKDIDTLIKIADDMIFAYTLVK